MSDRISHIKTQLEESRQNLTRVLDQVGDRWEEQVYADGLGWTVRQLLNHLVDSDRGHNAQAMNIAQGKDIIPEDFDVQRYNRRTTEKTADKSAEQARAELEEHRRQLYDWLDGIDESALDQKGRHASLRIMSVEEILLFQADHERAHTDDIARTLDIQQ
jgi:uncharacterized damage-inducible protein DinB